MNSNLSPAQFGATLGSLTPGQKFTLPGHDGVYTTTHVDVHAGKARVSYRNGSDPQEYSYIGPSLNAVDTR